VCAGADTLALPKNQGIMFGKSTNLKSLHLEIHYNNPEGDTNATDSSGLTALITITPRDIECASCFD
jgi:hypothetical protein